MTARSRLEAELDIAKEVHSFDSIPEERTIIRTHDGNQLRTAKPDLLKLFLSGEMEKGPAARGCSTKAYRSSPFQVGSGDAVVVHAQLFAVLHSSVLRHGDTMTIQSR